MKKIYLLRHCEAERHPTLNYTVDNLTKQGIEQALSFAKTFDNNLTTIISSPHLRTLKTAEIISREKRINLVISQNWKEISRGIYTERPYKEFLDEWAKKNNDYNYVPLQGESVNQGRKRIINGIEEVMELNGDVMCVTHAGVISNLLMMLYSFNFEQGKPNIGNFCELHFDGSNFILKPELNTFLNINKVISSSKDKLDKFK